MDMTSRELLREALLLPPEARAALAAELIESLDGGETDEGVEAAWATEIRRRLADVDAGTTKTIPWEEFRRRIMTAAGAPPR